MIEIIDKIRNLEENEIIMDKDMFEQIVASERNIKKEKIKKLNY